MKHDFEIILSWSRRSSRRIQYFPECLNSQLACAIIGVRLEAVVQKFLPGLFKISLARKRTKCFTHDVMGLRRFQAANAREDFDLGDAAKERLDQRLHRHERAVRSARVTP